MGGEPGVREAKHPGSGHGSLGSGGQSLQVHGIQGGSGGLLPDW